MTQILARFGAVVFLGLVVTFGVGLASFLRGARYSDDPTFDLHIYLGLAAVFATLAIHCLIFIYFLGTGRWVKEVAIAYRLPDDPLPKRTRKLKRHTFPAALAAMLVAIATAAAGAGAWWQGWPWPVHFSLGIATLLVNAWAFRVEYHDVAINAGVIDGVMREVDRIRAERGLPSNAEALRRDQES
jgi:cytochrome bd-type quinol oxidase subunit 2